MRRRLMVLLAVAALVGGLAAGGSQAGQGQFCDGAVDTDCAHPHGDYDLIDCDVYVGLGYAHVVYAGPCVHAPGY